MNFFPTFVIPLERLSCCHHSVQICGKVAFTCTGKLAIILNPEVTTASVQTTPFPSPPATVAGGCYYEVNASKKEMKPNKACECEFFQPAFGTLLLLSSFSRVRLCVTPWTAAQQAPPSLEFSRQEHWSGLPFPSPMHESEVTQSCPTLSDPMDCSLPGSSVHGICQARVLEWGAIGEP